MKISWDRQDWKVHPESMINEKDKKGKYLESVFATGTHANDLTRGVWVWDTRGAGKLVDIGVGMMCRSVGTRQTVRFFIDKEPKIDNKNRNIIKCYGVS